MTKRRSRRKPKRIHLRFRKNDPAHNLQAAVQHWVKAKGGDIVLIGAIEVQQWPGEGVGNYRIAVRCMGRAPERDKAGENLEKRDA